MTYTAAEISRGRRSAIQQRVADLTKRLENARFYVQESQNPQSKAQWIETEVEMKTELESLLEQLEPVPNRTIPSPGAKHGT